MECNLPDIRNEIERQIAAGRFANAHALLGSYWRSNPGPATAPFVLSQFEKLRAGVGATTARAAILRSFTVEPLVPLLRAAAAASRIDLQVYVGGFNAYAQEILDASSDFYQFRPDIVLLAVQTRDLVPELWNDFSRISPAEVEDVVGRATGLLQNLIGAFRERSQASLVAHTLESPMFPSQGVLDLQSDQSQLGAIKALNERLCACAREYAGVYALDYDALVARSGRRHWHDEQKWLAIRLPISANCLIHQVDEWMRFIQPLSGRICKALVVDLDNTLWGGVLGEDGIEGIAIGTEYPGSAYLDFQRAILDLYHRGVLLAICSKNDEREAMNALRSHPRMLLRPEHFAAVRINWNEKAGNLIEIAAELNLGADALAFVDDNPVECEQVRLALPEINVIQLPSDPARYSLTLRSNPVFERLALSVEDRERSDYYATQRRRQDLRNNASSLEEFFRSLRQRVSFAEASSKTLSRVAQLTQKTNQFNLTTRRYREQDIAAMLARPEFGVVTVSVSDRFGDNGMVGVAITRDEGFACEIDTLLLSCRVIGRTIETALLAYLIQRARSRDIRSLKGWFLPTVKNVPAKDFFLSHGFSLAREESRGSLWRLDLTTSKLTFPEWIAVQVAEKTDL
ncbi:MAG: HAD-IIIC family phosphatase [Acidobacteria bacterium]|nr:HAD-IIIC family phosphatase [Acidobacteriota bacterium]